MRCGRISKGHYGSPPLSHNTEAADELVQGYLSACVAVRASFPRRLLIIGVVGLASTYANEQNSHAYFGGAAALSSGLALLVAFFESHVPAEALLNSSSARFDYVGLGSWSCKNAASREGARIDATPNGIEPPGSS